jgi:drug/metabolite transporter (DMT)-like permease
LFTAVVAALAWRRLPGARQRIGLLIGFLGVVVVSWPSLGGAHSTALGAGLVLLATVLYGVAFNLAAPLEERCGALPVVWRAEIVALVLLAPMGLVGRVGSTRASVTVYFLPPVAIVLGALVRDEQVAAASVLGTGLVAAGAYLASRRERRTAKPAGERSPTPRPRGRAPPPLARSWASGQHERA